MLKTKNGKTIFFILVIAVILANIKSIFNEYDADAGYAVSMAYRMVKGDHLLAQMWEPHQTSAFLCAFLIKIYLLITGSITGIVLYLQSAGVLIRCLFLIYFYQTMKPFIRKDILCLMWLFFFSVTPKSLPIPDFSNMLIWFSTGVFCSLIRYLNSEKKIWLITSAIFMCLTVLSYPSAVILFAGIVFILWKNSPRKHTDILIFSSICIIAGVLYLLFILQHVPLHDLFGNLTNIFVSDSFHQQSLIDKLFMYTKQILIMILPLAVIALITKLAYRKNWIITFFIAIFAWDLIYTLTLNMKYDYRPPLYLPIILLAFITYKYCTQNEQLIFASGMIIGLLTYISVLILTNWDIAATVSYLILPVMLSFLPIVRWAENHQNNIAKTWCYALLFVFCGLTIFRGGYLAKGMNSQKISVFEVGGIVRNGPAAGIVSEYMGPYMLNSAKQEWEHYIYPGDSVLIVCEDSYDSLQYLFEDVIISTPSTISTPTYDEHLLEYWDKYPEKFPDVVIVECWYGELRVNEDSFIMKWLAEEYPDCEYTEGSYWRYYRID